MCVSINIKTKYRNISKCKHIQILKYRNSKPTDTNNPILETNSQTPSNFHPFQRGSKIAFVCVKSKDF